MQIPSKANPVDTASKFTAEPVRQGNDASGSNFNQVLSGQIKAQNNGSNSAANVHTPVKTTNASNTTQKPAAKNATPANAAQNADNNDNNKTADAGNAQATQAAQPAQNSDLAAYVASLTQTQPVAPPVAAANGVTPGTAAATNTLPAAGSASSLAAIAQANSAATSVLPATVPVTSKESQTSKFADLMSTTNDKLGKLNPKDGKTAELENAISGSDSTNSKLSAMTGTDTDPQILKQLAADATQVSANTTITSSNPAAPAQFANMLGGVAPSSDSDKITPKLGSADWDQAVGQKVVWMVAGGKQTAELTLNPPDLGPLRIVVSVNNDQASASFVTSHPDVKNALEAAFPKLQQMMGDSGVQLSGFSVSTQSSNQSSPQFERPKNQNSGSASSGNASVSEPSVVTTTTRINKNLGMVDTFA